MSILEQMMRQAEMPKFKSKDESKKYLEEFLNRDNNTEIEVGDYIVRNATYGGHYKLDGNQACQVIKKYPSQLDNEGTWSNAVIAVALGPTLGVQFFTVNLGAFDKAKAEKKNVFSLITRNKKDD